MATFGNKIRSGLSAKLHSEDVISRYKFQNNADDEKNLNDGTATNISYVNGLIGRAASFNGINSNVDISHSSSLSFTDGLNDLPFSISFVCKFDSFNPVNVGDWMINNRDLLGVKSEYQIVIFNDRLYLQLLDIADRYISFNTPVLGLTTGVYYHFGCSYNGSNGADLYVNGISNSISFLDTGYTGMVTKPTCFTRFGAKTWDTTSKFDGVLDDVIYWNKNLNYKQWKNLATQQLNGIDINV